MTPVSGARRRRARLAAMRRALLLTLTLCALALAPARTAHALTSLSRAEMREMRDEVRGMFFETLENYLRLAHPMDELKPLSCVGANTFGSDEGFAVTLIDALDACAVLGNKTAFERGVRLVAERGRFDVDAHVSVFEMNIRVLGGLLSAHLLASDEATGFKLDWYNGELLELAKEVGEAFLPAFETATGIPYGAINLKYGVEANETTVTSTASAGSLMLEFGTLSALTGDLRFVRAAERSLEALWERRSVIGLVGAHIDIQTGTWTQAEASVGAGIDSFYEYLLKSYMLFGNERHLEIFEEAYAAIEAHVRVAPWYLESGMMTGQVITSRYDSLMSFWPGLQTLYGDIETATTTHDAFFQVWKHYGFTPEGFDVNTGSAIPGQKPYPLRPELIESTYLLYKATGDVSYVSCGRDFLASLRLLKTECGYAHISDVSTQKLVDKMESFFLTETLKYLYLLFDAALDRENIVDGGPYPYIFTTEAHILPMKSSIDAKDHREQYSKTRPTTKPTASLMRSLLQGSVAAISNFRHEFVDHYQTRKPDKFCNYHSLLWQIGLRPAPERPHNLTERLRGITGRPNGVRTLINTMKEYFQRINRPDQRLTVRIGVEALLNAGDDVQISRRMAVLLSLTHESLKEISNSYFGGILCAKLINFRVVSAANNGVNDSVDFDFQTKIAYNLASPCIGRSIMRALGSMMHAYAHEIGSVYDCPISRMSYIPFTEYEDPNVDAAPARHAAADVATKTNKNPTAAEAA